MLFIYSCTPKVVPLKGDYPATPMVFKSDKSFDKAWDRLIDIFAQKGLAIKLIDRSSGLIVSDRYQLTATIENKDGVVRDSTAYIAIPKYIVNGAAVPVTGKKGSSSSVKKQLEANPVYGEWNVRIKQAGANSTVNVNINNVSYSDPGTKATIYLNNYRSTGVFETTLINMINE